MSPPTLDDLRVLMMLADHPDQSPCDAIRFDQASGVFVRAMLTGMRMGGGPPHAALLDALEEHRTAREVAEAVVAKLAAALQAILSWHEFNPHDDWCVTLKGDERGDRGYCNCHRGRIVNKCREALAAKVTP